MFKVLTVALVFFAAIQVHFANAQMPGWSILSTSPRPIVPNSPGTVTIRYTQDPLSLGTNCSFLFGLDDPRSIFPIISGNLLTYEIRHSSGVTPEIEKFCDRTFPVAALPAGQYSVRLNRIPSEPFFQPRLEFIGQICVGPCPPPPQSVPLNFSAGSPLWWVAIAAFLGLGVTAVRRRGLRR